MRAEQSDRRSWGSELENRLVVGESRRAEDQAERH